MDFVKKHYEKILLTVVLLGLVGALVFLPFLIAQDQQRQSEIRSGVLNPKVQPLPALDLSRQTNVVGRLQLPYALDFSTTNKLFNPMPWQKAPNSPVLIPGKLLGPDKAVVTKTTPLYLIVSLDSIDTNSLATNAQSARFVISVERQAAAVPGQRGKRPHYASLGEKVDMFKILEVKGAIEDPAQLELIVQLTDAAGGRATITRDKPFRRVDGYMADLKYDPDGKKWQGQRVDNVLKFAGDDYNIVYIDQNSVILSARSNQKKTTLTYSP
jgi:hypothetical protein